VKNVDGSIIFPAGIPSHRLVRRKLEKHRHLRDRLLDPQLYLVELDARAASKTCARLATYPWFPAASRVPQFKSGSMKVAAFERTLKTSIDKKWVRSLPTESQEILRLASACVSFQETMGCQTVVLPAPLVRDENDSLDQALAWIDAGIEAMKTSELPCLATLAISDTALRGLDPSQNGLLSAALNALTAREELAGVYLVLEQTSEPGYFCSHPDTIAALCWLVSEFRRAKVDRIFVAPCGPFGLALCGLGATDWTGGWYRSERKQRLADCEDNEGRAHPTFYSHALAGDVHLKQDLDNLVAAKLIGVLEKPTSFSAILSSALLKNNRVQQVPSWRFLGGNVTAARAHFLEVAVTETSALNKLPEATRSSYVTTWLKKAKDLASQASATGYVLHPRTEIGHQATWLARVVKELARSPTP
jgi:hypothetical protein